ncbi:GAF and ANTAR domain-containing protein [Flexivirga alba]|uniref:GAF and ANTAR domain-containing protein n=1 Tax=Flexivirga alba TaxID=702742 RepID=A0ABW2AJN4_9MICO
MSHETKDFGRARAFEQISRDLMHAGGEQPTLALITELAVETVPACDACGVSIRRTDGTVDTPACTSPLVEKADALQYEFGEGPCLDAVWKLDTYVIEDMESEKRWPRWAPAAAELGFRAILSVRLDTPERTLGGLNLYAHAPDVFDNTDVMIASIFARHAANALTATRRNDGLHTALQTRQAIGIAQGMLMQRYGLNLDQAFEVLRRYSQEQNIKLRVVAEELVAAGTITQGIGATLNEAEPETASAGSPPQQVSRPAV